MFLTLAGFVWLFVLRLIALSDHPAKLMFCVLWTIIVIAAIQFIPSEEKT